MLTTDSNAKTRSKIEGWSRAASIEGQRDKTEEVGYSKMTLEGSKDRDSCPTASLYPPTSCSDPDRF